VRFTAADGVTPLAFERRAHDAARKEAVYWVRLNKIWPRGGAFYVYYRPTPNTDLSDTGRMWPTNKYRAVLQMNETAGTTLLDSTPNKRNVGLGARTLGAPGRIGTGTGGDGAADALAGNLFASAFTYSAWIKPAAYGTTLAGAIQDGAWDPVCNLAVNPSGKLKVDYHHGNGWAADALVSSSTIPLDEWTRVTYVVQPFHAQFLYINGVQEARAGTAHGPWYSTGGTRAWPVRNFNGVIDEVRITEGALDPQQIMTEYLSETDRLLKYGEPEAGADAER